MWIAPFVALFMWLISNVCFVFGLSFKNPVLVWGFDATLYIAFGLSISNTAIQLLGNGMKLDRGTDGVFFWIWLASYALGISSNTNTLLQILGIDSKVLEWTIAIALGAMIEIAPEKMIVMWLKSISQQKQTQNNNVHQKGKDHSHFVPAYRQYNSGKDHGNGTQRRQELEKGRRETTYNPTSLANLMNEVMNEQKQGSNRHFGE